MPVAGYVDVSIRFGKKEESSVKIIDMHCDTIYAIWEGRKRGEKISLRENALMIDLMKLKKGNYSVQNFALFVEQKKGEGAFKQVKELLIVFQEEMQENQELISQVYTVGDILDNEKKGKLSALLTVEEGGVCEGKLENLYFLYKQGVRMMTLTWNFPNEIGYPNISKNRDCYTPDVENGLTKTGICFVEEMEKIGMIIDVSHLSDAGFYDVLHHTKKPFVASHSNARAVCPWVRNLTDDMIRELGERGGVAGLNYCADFLRDRHFNNVDEATGGAQKGEYIFVEAIALHARYMADVGGIECVGLGSDFDGIPYNSEFSGADKIQRLVDAFAKKGFHESEIDKILYRNVFRLYQDVLK